MMNDKELADRIVALGVAGGGIEGEDYYYLIVDDRGGVPACELVRDWRVAGALMEKLESYDGFLLQQSGDDTGMCRVEVSGGVGVNGNMCRAINEACCEALDDKAT